jgi:pyruvate formate lyase activating enzyme
MRIGGLQKSSLIDYPGKISAIVFTQGCNFACPYCHNPELFTNADNFSIEESSVLDFFKTRINKLDAVVISGGEPCLQKDIIDFIKKIKEMGFLVKLDTNGSFPDVLQSLLAQNLLDYVAMDIKAPIEKYEEVANYKGDPKNILQSITLLSKSNIDYEFRTTVVKSQLSNDDFEKIGEMINGASLYYLQKFVSTKTLNKSFLEQSTYSNEEFEQIAKKLSKHIKKVEIR